MFANLPPGVGDENLPIEDLVRAENMNRVDCVSCGRCVDTCQFDARGFTWRGGPADVRKTNSPQDP